jgi:hypothetical protein
LAGDNGICEILEEKQIPSPSLSKAMTPALSDTLRAACVVRSSTSGTGQPLLFFHSRDHAWF